MADPFSIVAGAMGVAEICFRIVLSVKGLRRELSSIAQELEHLASDVEELSTVCHLIKDTFNSSSLAASSSTRGARTAASTEALWEHLGKNINHCHALARKLKLVVEDICGDPGRKGPPLLNQYNQAARKKSRGEELRRYRAQIDMFQNSLHLMLTFIILNDTKGSHDQNARSFEDLRADLQRLEHNIQSQISDVGTSAERHQYDDAALAALCELQGSIASAADSISETRENKHFDIPQSVSSIFTGRETLLQDLQEIFIPPTGIARRQQRRFVIYGLGGSGKTQFCCKFAEDNQDRFWGVFWIDASTEERIKHTLGIIAEEYAGREKNEAAALNWLSNLEHTWLLIIDNADDSDIQLDKYFPKGNNGNILITTRNPAHKLHGNVGAGHYDFGPLGFSEATSLLLKASAHPLPWESSLESLALRTAEKLGFLALAIVHAGAVIRDKLCHLKDYPEYYRRSWKRIRSAKMKRSPDNEDIIHATWEICYKRLAGKAKEEESANDAIHLLKTFAFFHRDNISPDILRRAMENAALESEQEDKEARDEAAELSHQRPFTWAGLFRSAAMALLSILLKDRSLEALPGVIRDGRLSGSIEDSLDRIGIALRQLAQMSLVIYNERNDTYCIHTIVHNWARERFSLAEQDLWANISGRVLAASILLPPLGLKAEDEKFHVSLLPHIEHVQGCRSSIAANLPKKPGGTVHGLLPPLPTTQESKMQMLAKFSLIYFKCGYWENAAALLSDVRDFLNQHLGHEHKRSRRVTLYLSELYFHLGRGPDAQKLQRQVLDSCMSSLGPDHADTLRAMARLGHTLWMQGHFTEARSLQKQAMCGLADQLGEEHPDTLDTMDKLGITMGKFWRQKDLEEAYELHKRALEGMGKIHGPEHERTLTAKENLCRIAVHLGGRPQRTAPEMMGEILSSRKTLLGHDHPHTLMAMVNMAITQSACGLHDEAERLLREAERLLHNGVTIAARTLDATHIGVLFGQQTLACVLTEQKRYDEAIDILVDVAAKQKDMEAKRGDFHPDRLGTLIALARCYYLRGEVHRSLEVTHEAIAGFEMITDLEHPLAKGMVAARSKMEAIIEDAEHERPHIHFPSHLFHVETS